ncbi:MAG TPA: hypothetical protein EYQ35_00525, partial [candidate division UBP10 bacterium]|nr:hypothetical protein [Candidatus Binatota bacterium]
MAISGDTAIVGAPYDWDPPAPTTYWSGSAYIYQRDEGGVNNWGEVKKITASDAAGGDQFGTSVAISGDTAIVGAWRNDDAGSDSGS